MKCLKLFLIFLIVILCFNHKLEAQWIQTSGPSNGYVYILGTTSLDRLFAGTGGGVFRSTDNGSNWISLTNGVSDSNWVYSIATSDSNIFAGTDSGLYLSTNYGNTWSQVGGGLINHVNAIAINGMNVYAGTGGGVYCSTNLGSTWSSHKLDTTWVYSLLVKGNRLWVGTDKGVFFSKDTGISWKQINDGLTNSTVFSLTTNGSSVFAGTVSGIFVIPIDSTSWTKISNFPFVFSILSTDNNLYAGTGHGIFLSTDKGSNWIEVDSGMTNKDVNTIILNGDYLYAGTWGSGVWKRPLKEITSVESIQSELSNYKLFQNYPDPFNPSTIISYRIPENTLVILKLYDVLGRELQTIVNRRESSGVHFVTFNAHNLPSGVYFYRLQAGSFTQTKKFLLLR